MKRILTNLLLNLKCALTLGQLSLNAVGKFKLTRKTSRKELDV